MQTMLIVVELLVAVALIIFVLLQRSEGGALGMGGGGSGLGGLFSPARRGRYADAHHRHPGGAVLSDLPRPQSAGAAWPQREIDPRFGACRAGNDRAGAKPVAPSTGAPKPAVPTPH